MTITHELNTDELVNLLVDNVYEDAVPHKVTDEGGEHMVLSSANTMSYAYVWTTPHTVVGFTKYRYDRLLEAAEVRGAYTPLFIVGTSEGVYEFNMDVLKVQWEAYSDGESPDMLVADLALSQGKHILPFYPEFASEEDYYDSLMSDATPSVWDEGDSW